MYWIFLFFSRALAVFVPTFFCIFAHVFSSLPHTAMLWNLHAYGRDVVFIDTTHVVNRYNHKMFVVSVRVRSRVRLFSYAVFSRCFCVDFVKKIVKNTHVRFVRAPPLTGLQSALAHGDDGHHGRGDHAAVLRGCLVLPRHVLVRHGQNVLFCSSLLDLTLCVSAPCARERVCEVRATVRDVSLCL